MSTTDTFETDGEQDIVPPPCFICGDEAYPSQVCNFCIRGFISTLYKSRSEIKKEDKK